MTSTSGEASGYDVDVVVVGGGPSGLTVAAEIARTGASVRVLEKRVGAVPSRAGVLQPRVLELLDARGLMGRFRERAEQWRPDCEIPGYIYAGLNGVRYDQLDSRFPYALILPQSATEELLEEWALEAGAEIMHGATYVSYLALTDGVVVVADHDGAEFVTRARYAVASDGSRSLLREHAGLPFEGRRTDMTGIVADADLPFPWPASMVMRHNEHGWVLTYPFGLNTTRFAIVTEKRRHTPKSEPVMVEELREGLVDLFGDDLGVETVSWTSRYGNAHRIVPCLKRGRVHILGEAARVHYPASGVGMNFCIQDAFNLGWKLGLVTTGRADMSLLDSYHAERYPVAEQLMADVDAQVALQFDFSTAGRTLKNLVESDLIPIPDVNELLRGRLSGCGSRYRAPESPDGVVGSRVADVKVEASTASRLPELLQAADFVLVGRESVDIEPDLAPGVELVSVRSGDLGRGLGGVHSVLVRPDSYVGAAWASKPSTADVAEALKQVLSDGLSRADVAVQGGTHR